MYGNDQSEVFLGRDLTHTSNYSDETLRLIDEEIKNLVEEAYRKCESILTEHADQVHLVASALLEREKLDSEEFKKLMSGQTIDGPDPDSVPTESENNQPEMTSADEVSSEN